MKTHPLPLFISIVLFITFIWLVVYYGYAPDEGIKQTRKEKIDFSIDKDTIIVTTPTPAFFKDSVLKVLLIQYYKAGWMAGSDGVIDLYNADRLDNKHVDAIQKVDWRSIEKQVMSK